MNILSGAEEECDVEQETQGAEGSAVGGAGLWAAFELSQKAIDKYVNKRRGKEPKQQSFADSQAERSRLLRLRRLPDDTKFFIIQGGRYEDVRKGLVARGWVENLDPEGCVFDLKWTLRRNDIDFSSIEESQVVNHFDNNAALTTKVGLIRNLRQLHWSHDVDIDCFFPRAYDLSDSDEVDAFVEDFRCSCAWGVLNRSVRQCEAGQGDMIAPEGVIAALAVCWHWLVRTQALVS